MEDTLIAKKLNAFVEQSYKPDVIDMFSDEVLDKANTLRRPIEKITEALTILNKSLIDYFNEEPNSLISLSDIQLLNKTVNLNARLYANWRKSRYHRYYKETLELFNEQREWYKEIAHDFIEYRTDSDSLKNLKSRLQSS